MPPENYCTCCRDIHEGQTCAEYEEQVRQNRINHRCHLCP